MQWLDFKLAVADLITVDSDRLGVETYIDRLTRLAVGEIQRLIPAYRIGHETIYTEEDLTDDGFASLGELPADAYISELYHVKVGSKCVSRPLYPWDYNNRRDLTCGVVDIGCSTNWFRYTTDPQMRKLWVYPRITSGYQVKLVWDGRKTSFEDTDETPFDEQCTLVVAEYLKMKIAREVDRDLKMATDYERTWRQGLTRLDVDIKSRWYDRSRKSKSHYAASNLNPCTQCGCTTNTCGCDCQPVTVVALIDTAGYTCGDNTCGTACSTIELPEMEWVMFGDSGEDAYMPSTVAVATAVKAINPQFIIHLGDTNYPSGRASGLQDHLLNPYFAYIADNFYAAFGNHDLETGYGMPLYSRLPLLGELIGDDNFSSKQLWYQFSRGNVRFFVLNTGLNDDDDDVQFDAQVAWLQAAIEGASDQWKVVVMHRPAYTSDTNNHPGSTLWRLPFGTWGASMVIAGHSHNYERFEPETDQIPYLNCGLGGAEIRGFHSPIEDDSQYRYNSTNAFLHFTATSTKLQASLTTSDGFIVDRVILEKVDATTGGGGEVSCTCINDTGVAGVEALRAITSHIHTQLAYLLYIVSSGDGGQGQFYYDATSTDADDDSSVIKPNNVDSGDPGRWKRVS